jgi:flagellar biosynthetic protein FliR
MIAGIPFLDLIQAFLAIGVRLSGVMLFAPFLGSMVIPARVKAILVIALTILLYPMVKQNIPQLPIVEWPLLVFKELVIGVGVGIVTSLVFDAVQMAGQILSIQMGYSLVNILDPTTQVESTVMALFHQSLAMLIFLRLDVHLWLLRALGNSFSYLPPGSGHLSGAFTLALLQSGSEVIAVGLQIAAPVLSATLLADIVFGLLGKSSPQLPLMQLGPAVKSLMGIAILIASLKYWPDLFRKLFLDSIDLSDRLMHLAR